MKIGTFTSRPSPAPSLGALDAASSSNSSALPTSRSPPSAAPPAPGDEGSSAFARVLRGLAATIERGEGVAERVGRGGAVASDPASLIALQADLYRYVEAVDLASKLVDRATGAVKTVLQGQ